MNVWQRIFASRKVWIALATVAACIVVVVGADPAKWTPLISAIVGVAIAVITSIGIEDGAEKLGGGSLPPSDRGGTPPLVSLLLPLMLLFMIGCASTDQVSITAEQWRKSAIEPVVLEHADRHPEQAATWTDWLTAWQRDIDRRAGKPVTKDAPLSPSSKSDEVPPFLKN